MGKYSSHVRQQTPRSPQGPHNIWRGLGCLMMVVVAVMSIAGAISLVELGISQGWPIPPELLRPVVLPDFIYSMPGLASLLLKVVSINYLPAYIALSLLLMVFLGGIVSILYAILYRFTAPPRYGPLDSPPIKRGENQ